MAELLQLNLILNHFMNANVHSIVFFNCWQLETQELCWHMMADNLRYIRFVNIENADFTPDFEYRYLLHKRPTLGGFIDMSCRRTEQLLSTLSRWRLYNEHYDWLLYDRAADLQNFHRLFVNANLSVDAQLTYATLNPDSSCNNSASFILYDVYNNGRFLGGKLNVTIDREVICTSQGCELARYLSKLHLRPKYGNRNWLHDITMRVTTVVTKRPLSLPVPELLEFLYTDNNTDIDPISRFGFKVLLLFKDFFGCKMVLTFRDRWSTNETHGGTVGDIVTEKADFASSPYLCTASRLKYVSVMAETGGFRSLCLFRTPQRTDIKGSAFLQPFDATVWLIFCVLLALSAIFLWRTFALERRFLRHYWCYKPSLLAAGLLAFGSACYQGSNLVPRSTGGRVAYITLYMITFIMYNYYTSVVVSTLLGTPIKSDIKTLGQLADSALEVGLEPLPYTFVYLNVSQLPDVRRFVRRKIESKSHPERLWMSVKEGLLRVRDEPGFVFVLETSTSYGMLERHFEPHEICDLNEVMLRPDKSVYTQLHKNSSYKELTRLRAMRMLETGVWHKHRRMWVKDKLNCLPSNHLVVVSMEYTAPLFLLLACSYVISLMLLFIERCFWRFVTPYLRYRRHLREMRKQFLLLEETTDNISTSG